MTLLPTDEVLKHVVAQRDLLQQQVDELKLKNRGLEQMVAACHRSLERATREISEAISKLS